MQQQDILDRYRRLREIGNRHHQAALDHLAQPTIMERAKHLGLTHHGSFTTDSDEEMTLAFDLAVHTARRGRSRAIDRYAKAVTCADPDEARVLDAIRNARFSLWRIVRRHDVAGLVVEDVLRERETWMIDEALTASVAPGQAFAGRLCWPDEFAIICGVVVPISAELIEEALLEAGYWAEDRPLRDIADDPRLAVAIYRTAVVQRTMESVRFRPIGATG
ncbi:hypothetical protein [Rhodopila sp.]|uniref:hypothetical protein n=1 Tax=Rhodopila sp. TaxID=2480087 RepID=UPI003D1229A5